jgi:hypothetical protein
LVAEEEAVTPVAKFLKNTKEKLLGTWEEGPEPPDRFRQLVEIFAKANPRATVGEWVEFAARHAASAYQQGYVRGFERGERLGPDWQDPDEAAALLNRLEATAAGEAPFDPSAVVPIEGVPREAAIKAFLAYSEAAQGSDMRAGPKR